MYCSFSNIRPNNFHPDPILISGHDSIHLNEEEYLITGEGDNRAVYKIRYEHHCSPFKQAEIVNDFLLLGHENYFYVFDLAKNVHVIRIGMNGYFGHLYVENNLCYIADANSLYCSEPNGNVLWRKGSLGIDGVIINSFDEDNIYGAGEWDPPGGWRAFTLERKTGRLLSY